MTRADAESALRAAASVGEFFAVDIDPGDSWIPLRELRDDREALAERVARTRRGVAESNGVAIDVVPLRAAASIDELGLVARLLSPALGACTLARVGPGFTPDNLRWHRVERRIGVVNPVGRVVTTAVQAADALSTDVIGAAVAPLVDAYATRFRLSTQVLWGNVASALNGAVEVLDASGVEQQLPAAGIAQHLLDTAALSGTARSASPRFVRNSCCLWYRIPGSTICGDCVLSA